MASIQENRIRIELGGFLSVEKRIQQAISRSGHILKYCFEESPVWLRIILWSAKEAENLKQTGFKLGKENMFFVDEVFGERVLCVYFDEYSELMGA